MSYELLLVLLLKMQSAWKPDKRKFPNFKYFLLNAKVSATPADQLLQLPRDLSS